MYKNERKRKYKYSTRKRNQNTATYSKELNWPGHTDETAQRRGPSTTSNNVIFRPVIYVDTITVHRIRRVKRRPSDGGSGSERPLHTNNCANVSQSVTTCSLFHCSRPADDENRKRRGVFDSIEKIKRKAAQQLKTSRVSTMKA